MSSTDPTHGLAETIQSLSQIPPAERTEVLQQLKVNVLRGELSLRGLQKTGRKDVLVRRLGEAIDAEGRGEGGEGGDESGVGDAFMGGTLLVFLVGGPLLRSASQLVLLVAGLPPRAAARLHSLSRHASAFYALDVMVFAVPLLQLTMANMAGGMLSPATFSACARTNALHGGGPCLSVETLPAAGYYWMVLSVALFLASGFDGSPTHRFLHAQHRPDDADAPSLGCACPNAVKLGTPPLV